LTSWGQDFLARRDVEKPVLTLDEVGEEFLALPDVEKPILTPYEIGDDFLALADVGKSVLTFDELWGGTAVPMIRRTCSLVGVLGSVYLISWL
jgi:hypothetical protein